MNTDAISNKRKFENGLFQPLKRLKTESESPRPFDALSVSAEVWGHIFSFLSPKDLLQCERVSQHFSFFLLSNGCFESLMKKEHLNLEWSFSQSTPNPARANFIVNYFLKKFLKKTSGFFREDRCRLFFKKQILIDEINLIFKRIKETFLNQTDSEMSVDYSGDLILEGLKNHDKKSFTYFKEAINKKATFASFLAVKIFHYDQNHNYEDLDFNDLFQLCKLSADKGDLKPLQALVHQDPYSFMIKKLEENNSYPPIRWSLAKRSNSDTDENLISLYEEAIKSYNDHAPPHLLLELAAAYFKFETYDGVILELIKQILRAHKERIPGNTLKVIGDIYYEFNDLKKALNFYKQAWIALETRSVFKFPIPVSDNFLRALPKDKILSRAEFRNAMEEKSFSKSFVIDNKGKADLLVKMAEIEFSLGYDEEALQKYEQVIKDYGDNDNLTRLNVFEKTGDVLFKLGRFIEAGNYYRQAPFRYTNLITDSILKKRAEAHFKAKQYFHAAESYREIVRRVPYDKESLECLNKAVQHLEAQKLKEALKQNNKDPDLLYKLGENYFNRGKFAKAAQNYLLLADIHFEAKNFNETALIYIKVADSFYKLGDFRESVKFYNLALRP